MKTKNATLSALLLLTLAPACAPGGAADGEEAGRQTDDITDVDQTDVERQSIGNCWLYATASWMESMHLSATGSEFDTSQSYWTYWHWFEQIVDSRVSEIRTGGSETVSFSIIRRRGLMEEGDFLPEDTTSEMSSRQASALSFMNNELKNGRLKTSTARGDRKLVRQVMEEAWGLSSSVKGQLTKVFGETYNRTFSGSAVSGDTNVISPADFVVRYAKRSSTSTEPTLKDTSIKTATNEWRTTYYPWSESQRRSFQIRVQRALHDRQPVIITWNVDFNAMESGSGELRGSFNLETLEASGGPGRQGGHMTVLEDYEAITDAFGTLEAGVTLDPENPDDAERLAAALLPSTEIKFWRIKNSWGAFRDDRASAPGFPGYHDLYQTYLDGPIDWCPDVEGEKTEENCWGSTTPWKNVILPPGY